MADLVSLVLNVWVQSLSVVFHVSGRLLELDNGDVHMTVSDIHPRVKIHDLTLGGGSNNRTTYEVPFLEVSLLKHLSGYGRLLSPAVHIDV